MSKGEILDYLREGREWLRLLLPVFLAWHVEPPRYMKKAPK